MLIRMRQVGQVAFRILALKAFIKPFEAPQRSVIIKI